MVAIVVKIAEYKYKYNGVKKAAGYVGSNPAIFTKFERVQATG
jgi:hypothetical protein